MPLQYAGFIHRDNLDSILTLLADRLQLTFGPRKWFFVVCGGTALNALGLVVRTTKDIDVLGVPRAS
jgi:hypothetical protein